MDLLRLLPLLSECVRIPEGRVDSITDQLKGLPIKGLLVTTQRLGFARKTEAS
jgi:hypothetical protein